MRASQCKNLGIRKTPTRIGADRKRHVTQRAVCSQATRVPRGIVLLPGLGNNSSDYLTLCSRLRGLGLDSEVAPVSRLDWSRNAAALTDANWWRGSLTPRPAVNWYLKRVDSAVTALKQRLGEDGRITLLTHSAGGWLGRVYMLDFGTKGIDRFVSLGSPHSAPPAGVVDQTRGILTWCTDACPGAYHSQVSYVTIAGKYVKGSSLSGDGGWKAKFAGAGYQQVCGDAEVWGDFIVPLSAAHLPGATNIDLEGAFHSPLGAQLPVFGDWYGSDSFLQQWVGHLGSEEEMLQLQPAEQLAGSVAAPQ